MSVPNLWPSVCPCLPESEATIQSRLRESYCVSLTAPAVGISRPGYEWTARYGPLGMRVKLYARVLDAGEAGMGLATER